MEQNNEFGFVTPLNDEARLKERIEQLQVDTVEMEINEEGHLVTTLQGQEQLKDELDKIQIELLSARGEDKEVLLKKEKELEEKLELESSQK